MKTSVIRVLMVLVSLCILLSVANQLYIQFYSPYQTDVVYEYTFEQQLSAEGVFFKDETTVENGAQGVVKYQQANGSRVAKDAEIARIYPDEETVSAAEQADKLDEQIQQLTAVQSPGAALESNISVINQQLFHTYQNFLTSLDFDQFSGLSELRNELVTLLNKKQIVTGKASDFNAAIEQLTQARDALRASVSTEPVSVTTPASGYFVDTVDGYEGQLGLAEADSISLGDLQSLLDAEPEQAASGIGKVITQPQLRYVAQIPSDSLVGVTDNASCTIQFDSVPNRVPATITRIDRDDSGEYSLMVFEITQMSEALSLLRKDQAKIILSSSTGLRVPKSAIHLNEEGETGVYTIFGANMTFKKIDVIFENETYALCSYHTGESGYLQLYDTIIVKGKDLYDNKAVK